MSPVPGFLACCLFLMLSSSTSAREKFELFRIQPGEDVVLKCGLDVCGKADQGTVVMLNMFIWPAENEQMNLLATLKPKNETDGPVIYDLEIINSMNRALNITASDKEPGTIKVATADVQTGDAYLCVADYWHFNFKNKRCLTMLQIRDAPAQSTTGAPWSGQTTPAESATGGTCACDENHSKNSTAAEQEWLHLDVMSLLCFVVLVPLMVTIIVILTYRKCETRDMTQQTEKQVPEADALEIMVSNEPIYSVVKKW